MGRFNKAVTWVKLSELRAPYQLKRWFETLPFLVSERRVGSKRVESGMNEQDFEDAITGLLWDQNDHHEVGDVVHGRKAAMER